MEVKDMLRVANACYKCEQENEELDHRTIEQKQMPKGNIIYTLTCSKHHCSALGEENTIVNEWNRLQKNIRSCS